MALCQAMCMSHARSLAVCDAQLLSGPYARFLKGGFVYNYFPSVHAQSETPLWRAQFMVYTG